MAGRKSDQLIVLGERESRGKRLATDDSFWGDTGSMQRERQPSILLSSGFTAFREDFH